jgi:3-oxoadipate enol-lactonase
MPYAELSDVRLHYHVADYADPWREPAVVLLHHGFARNLEFWRAWVPLLARELRVLRFDARGCGESSIPPPGFAYSFEQAVADALGLLDHLGIARVHWVGEASGGIVGLSLALMHPQRIASLSLCNTPFRLPRATNDMFVPEEVERLGVGHWARKTLSNRLDLDKIDPRWVAWSIEQFDRNSPHAAIAQHGMIAGADLFERLPEVKAPVLVLAGANSRIAPADAMREMQARLPHARLQLSRAMGRASPSAFRSGARPRCARSSRVSETRAFTAATLRRGRA